MMNRVYRTVFNRSLGVWQAASELVKCPGNGWKRDCITECPDIWGMAG